MRAKEVADDTAGSRHARAEKGERALQVRLLLGGTLGGPPFPQRLLEERDVGGNGRRGAHAVRRITYGVRWP
jgi:hypothetical protein